MNETAIGGNEAAVHPVIDDADHKKERGGDDSVGQHLEEAAFNSLLIHGEDADGHETHVSHRGIGNELLHVLLHQRHKGCVDDGDDRQ